MSIAALIVAAGRGSRAGGELPKQYAEIAGAPVLSYTLKSFLSVDEVTDVQVVIHPDDSDHYRRAVAVEASRLWPPVPGGATRQASVLAGLEALSGVAPRLVLIHDAARPFVSPRVIRSVIDALSAEAGAIAAVPLADTLKRQGPGLAIAATVERAGLWRAQTPQGFRFREILAAHRRAAAAGLLDFTDDAAVAEWAGLTVTLVEDAAENTKITTAADLAAAAERLAPAAAAGNLEYRTGTGFDVHRFAAGESVWLCGVEIPHDARLDGHSDADVGLHAQTDAILGALGDGDIGQHFPPGDPRWKGAASALFLADAARRVAARGGRVVNVDVTLLCEAPRIGPFRDAMKAAIGRTLGIGPDRVGVKATTTEGLGFTGRREGIAAMASATVALPPA